MLGFLKIMLPFVVGCIFIDGNMGQYFALPLGVDDLCCHGD